MGVAILIIAMAVGLGLALIPYAQQIGQVLASMFQR